MAAALNLKLLAVNFLCMFPFLISLSEAKIASYIHEDDSGVLQPENRTSFCNDTTISFLPPPYRDQRGFACSQAWGPVAFKYLQDHDNVTTIVLSRDKFSGWIGIGFSKDGGMVGSSAVVGWTGEESGDEDMGWTGGDKDKYKDKAEPGIAKFFLKGKSAANVTPFEGEINFTDTPPFVIFYNNSFYMGFQAKFGAGLGLQYVILAVGSEQPYYNVTHVELTGHYNQAVMQVDFSTGYPTNNNKEEDLKASHGAMGLIAWGVLLPFGAIIPRYFKHHDPQWFYLHISIQIVGFLLGLATVIVGTTLYNKLHCNHPILRFMIHRFIGGFVLFLSILQVMALILRPDKSSKQRMYLNLYHHWIGRLALFLGALNILIGICIAEAGSVWKIGYGFLVTFILVTVTFLEAALGLGRSKKADATPVFGYN